MGKNWKAVALSVLLSVQALTVAAQHTIDLAGEWACPTFHQRVRLPGSLLTNHLGDEITVDTKWTGSLYDSSYYYNPYMARYREPGKMKFPFFLTPERHYIGKVGYQRTFKVPRSWRKRRVFLFLERPHIETTVFINGQKVGRDSSLSVPHEFEVTSFLRYGRQNDICIEIYNGIENVCVGQDSHSVTDQTQGNWNGIVGRIALDSRPQTFIDNVQVYPRIAAKSIDVDVLLGGETHKGRGTAPCFWIDGRAVKATMQNGRYRLFVGDSVELWDEFTPHLYTLTTVVGEDTLRTSFGMREIGVQGRQMVLNGHPLWLRGTVENCCFPLTGFPPTDEESWCALFRQCKAYGLNHVRFHSYCPPEAAFCAADRVGIYLQPEGPSWPNHGVRLRRGMSIDRYLLEETERMVRAYGNHPSFCMLAAGNEPAGDWVSWCVDFVNHWHQSGDDRRLYCGASVGGGWAWDANSDYHVKGGARGLDWERSAPQSADDYNDQMLRPRNFTTKRAPAYALALDTLQDGRVEQVNNSPIIAHEQGQWCAFPDFNEIAQYTGVYKAGNFEIFRDLLRDNGMANMDRKFLMASGRLQALAYKYEIERNLRTKDYAGFQLLGLNDYSGQGTALVGILNVFWREKGYSSARDWTAFCAPIVPLARFPKFVYTDRDTLCVPVELYNAGREPLREPLAMARITSADGAVIKTFPLHLKGSSSTSPTLPLGKNIALGEVNSLLDSLPVPAKYTLSVTVQSQNASEARNQWDFWVYPSSPVQPVPANIKLFHTFDDDAVSALQRGETVLIAAAGHIRYGNDVRQTYLPVFWNTSWFKMRPPHTTGAVIDSVHPLFRHFPTDSWANLNWWELLNRAQVMNLGKFPAHYQSPIQPIDTWHVSRKLGMLVEGKVLNGRLLVTTMDIENDLAHRPVAREMRQAILRYMSSETFKPSLTLNPQVIRNLFEQEAQPVNMFTNDSPDELKPKIK